MAVKLILQVEGTYHKTISVVAARAKFRELGKNVNLSNNEEEKFSFLFLVCVC